MSKKWGGILLLLHSVQLFSFQAQSSSCSAYVKLKMQSSVVYLLSRPHHLDLTLSPFYVLAE